MKERLPRVPLVMFCVVGLLVIYQVMLALPPEIDSHTLVVPAIRWPQPPGVPAAGQSSPPAMPPWKRSQGIMNDRVSPVQPPVTLDQLAPPAVQLLTHRLIPPLLLPSKKRRLVPVPTGSMRAKKPSPPKPSCHCTGPVGLPLNVTELGPLSCAPPTADGFADVAKLPLMSPE